jgi:hypothetical protein
MPQQCDGTSRREKGAKVRVALDLLVDVEIGVDHVFQCVAEERVER